MSQDWVASTVAARVENEALAEFLLSQSPFEVAVFLSQTGDAESVDDAVMYLMEAADNGWEPYAPLRGFEEFRAAYWDCVWEWYSEEFWTAEDQRETSFLAWIGRMQDGMNAASPEAIDELVLGLAYERTCHLLAGRIEAGGVA